MARRKFFLGLFFALSASACSKPLDDGYAVDITVKAVDSLAAAAVASVESLDFTVRGAERTTMSFPVTHAFSAERRETIIYRPLVASGDLEFVVRARRFGRHRRLCRRQAQPRPQEDGGADAVTLR